jgi:transcriptional regulator with XRE-family HTH domain
VVPGNPHTSVRSRTVAAELRALRETRGLTCADVARTLGVSPSKISRIETGNSGLQIQDVSVLLGFYQVPGTKRDELLDLLRRGDQKGWWERQPGLPQHWRTLIDFENKATHIRIYHPLRIPDLLQTGEYAQSTIGVTDGIELDNLVASRLASQALLIRSTPPQYHAVIHESALLAHIGAPGVMRRQLLHLLNIAERPNIELRATPHPGPPGMFMLLEFAEEPDLVHVEDQFLDRHADLMSYRQALHVIHAGSRTPAATADLIATIATAKS